MTKIVNLTPHDVNFMDENGNILATIAPSGTLARVSVSKDVVGVLDGIPIKQSTFGAIEGLPDPQDATIYLVSSIVASRCPDRADVFIPDDSVRDEGGRIIGCRSLGHV